MTNDLKMLRNGLNVSQAEFAQAMGVPVRTYEDLERGRSTIRPVHLRAAEMATLRLAFERAEPMAATTELVSFVRLYNVMIEQWREANMPK